MGFITVCAMSSRNLPEEGGYESVTAENAIGVVTFTASARPSCASASCTLAMAGTSFVFRSGLESNTSLPTATAWICVAGRYAATLSRTHWSALDGAEATSATFSLGTITITLMPVLARDVSTLGLAS